MWKLFLWNTASHVFLNILSRATCRRPVDWIVLLFPHHVTHWGYDVIDLIAPATSLSTYEKYIYFNLPSKYASIAELSIRLNDFRFYGVVIILRNIVLSFRHCQDPFSLSYFCFYSHFDLLSIRLSTRPEFSVRDALHHISHRLYVHTYRLAAYTCMYV